jgi:hypothetical protein
MPILLIMSNSTLKTYTSLIKEEIYRENGRKLPLYKPLAQSMAATIKSYHLTKPYSKLPFEN